MDRRRGDAPARRRLAGRQERRRAGGRRRPCRRCSAWARTDARRIVAHRAKELMRALEPQGVHFTGLDLDTAVAAYLLDAREGQASLGGSGRSRADARRGRAGSSARAAEEQLGFDLESARTTRIDGDRDGSRHRRTRRHAAAQVAMLGRLVPGIRQALEETGATRLYEDVERPLVRVLAKMEVAGIAVDIDRLRAISDELTSEAQRLEAEVAAARRRGVQRQLDSPAAPHPVREARARAAKAHEDGLLHRRPEPRCASATPIPWSTPSCATARSRSCAPPTERASSPRSLPTGGSTPRSTRPSPARAGSRRTSRTCTTSRCAASSGGASARPSCRAPARSC